MMNKRDFALIRPNLNLQFAVIILIVSALAAAELITCKMQVDSPTNTTTTARPESHINSTSSAKKATNSSFGDETAASLFRPALLGNLFNRRTKSSKDMGSEDGSGNEEEITQTIEVPLNQANSNGESLDEQSSSLQLASGQDDESGHAGDSRPSYRDQVGAGKSEQLHRRQNKQQTSANKNNLNKQIMMVNARAIEMLMKQQALGGANNKLNQRQIESYKLLGSLIANKKSQNIARRHFNMYNQLKPEASLRLSDSEMRQILLDREAPDGYKSRELNGEGVLVGEEPASDLGRLGTAASDHFSSSPGGFGGVGDGGPVYPMLGDVSPMDNPQARSLMNMASEHIGAAGDSFAHNSPFSHRFGALPNHYGADQFGQAQARLMQSPNEFNEMTANYPTASMGGHEAQAMGTGVSAGDYATQSGMLRAGSGESNFAGEVHSGGFYGGGTMGNLGYAASHEYSGNSEMGGGSAGFGYGGASHSQQAMLERHASEMHGANLNSEMGGPGGESGGNFHGADSYYPANGRLMSAGSNIGAGDSGFGSAGGSLEGRFGSGYAGSGSGSGEESASAYSAALGLAASQPDELALHERGIHTAGSSLHYPSSIQSRSGQHQGPASAGGLLPLTPTLPTAEDLSEMHQSDHYSSKASHRHTLMTKGANVQRKMQQQRQTRPHNPLAHDTNPNGDEDFDEADSRERTNDEQQNDERARGPSDLAGGSSSTTDAPNSNSMDSLSEENGPELDSANNEQQHDQQTSILLSNQSDMNSNNQQYESNSPRARSSDMVAVEFSRPGSAGYNAPKRIKQQKQNNQAKQQQQFRKRFLKKWSSNFGSSYNDPAQNPAHQGKYIIE